jgi:hypothetical protein
MGFCSIAIDTGVSAPFHKPNQNNKKTNQTGLKLAGFYSDMELKFAD